MIAGSAAAASFDRPAYLDQLDAHRWLPAAASVESLAAQGQPEYVQELARVRSLLGDWSGALDAFESFLGRDSVPPLETRSTLDSADALDAEAVVLQLARDHRLVILNEAHHDASHRVFAARIAHGLRALGFRYLACETFDPRDSIVEALGRSRVVEYRTGYFTREPCFAEFVRSALVDGYEPVAYEAINASQFGDFVTRFNSRDALEADNLIARTFARDSSARVFVYCGYDHVMEEPDSESGGPAVRALAARLKSLTGLDPLTVDQTVGEAPSRSERGTRVWRYAEAHGRLRFPYTVFRLRDGRGWYVSGKYRGRVDLQVFHAPVEFLGGRPTWMARQGDRTAVMIPSVLRPSTGRLVIEAHRVDDGPEVVPVDRLVITAGRDVPVLMLPPGAYWLTAQDDAGRLSGVTRIRVPDRSR